MAVSDTHVFHGFLTTVLTQLFFPKPLTTFLKCFCRGERRKYAGRKVRPIRGSNPQPPGHESDMLTTKLPGRGRTGRLWDEMDLMGVCLYGVVLGKLHCWNATSTSFARECVSVKFIQRIQPVLSLSHNNLVKFNPLPHNPYFWRPWERNLYRKHCGYQHFLLFPQCFLSAQIKFQIFSHFYFVVCKCFRFRQA